jgi:hypothetical protein
MRRLCLTRLRERHGVEPATETPEAFARFILADRDRSAAPLKAADFHPE